MRYHQLTSMVRLQIFIQDFQRKTWMKKVTAIQQNYFVALVQNATVHDSTLIHEQLLLVCLKKKYVNRRKLSYFEFLRYAIVLAPIFLIDN